MLEYICKSSLSTISNGICIKICTDVMAMQNSPPQESVRLFHCLGLLVGKLLLLHAPLLKHLQSVLHVLHVCPVHPYGGFRLLIFFFFPIQLIQLQWICLSLYFRYTLISVGFKKNKSRYKDFKALYRLLLGNIHLPMVMLQLFFHHPSRLFISVVDGLLFYSCVLLAETILV